MINIMRKLSSGSSPSIVAAVSPTDASYVTRAYMADEQAYIEFYSEEEIAFMPYDYVVVDGQYYFIAEPPVPNVEQDAYKYSISFKGAEWELEKTMFFVFDRTGYDNVYDTTYNTTPADILDLIIANLNRNSVHEWVAGDALSHSAVDISFNKNSVLEVLQSAAQLFDTEYEIIGFQINIKNKTTASPLLLEPGRDKPLTWVRDNKGVDRTAVTRLYAYGNSTNMPSGQRLTIDPFEVANAWNIVEEIKEFDDIYPQARYSIYDASVYHMTGYFWRFKASLGYSLDDYLIDGINPVITFVTGNLAGISYTDWSYTMLTSTTIRIDLVAVVNGVDMTQEIAYALENGDIFEISGITTPSEAISLAEYQLYSAANAYFAKITNYQLKLNLGINTIYSRANLLTLHPGDQVTVKHPRISSLAAGVAATINSFKLLINDPYNYTDVIAGDVFYRQKYAPVIKLIEKAAPTIAITDGDDLKYTHYQIEEATQWTIKHNMGKYPAITVFVGNTAIVVETLWQDFNTAVINLPVAASGYAICN